MNVLPDFFNCHNAHCIQTESGPNFYTTRISILVELFDVEVVGKMNGKMKFKKISWGKSVTYCLTTSQNSQPHVAICRWDITPRVEKCRRPKFFCDHCSGDLEMLFFWAGYGGFLTLNQFHRKSESSEVEFSMQFERLINVTYEKLYVLPTYMIYKMNIFGCRETSHLLPYISRFSFYFFNLGNFFAFLLQLGRHFPFFLIGLHTCILF